MLAKLLNAVIALEAADEARIPQLAGDAQVLASAHQRVALAAFSGHRDAVDVKVLLLAACNRHEAVLLIRPFVRGGG